MIQQRADSIHDTPSENCGGAWLVDQSSMEAKCVLSSQANLIKSAIYFLIHLPHREHTFLKGEAFVVNPLGTILRRGVQCFLSSRSI